jgi:hypothetical protein
MPFKWVPIAAKTCRIAMADNPDFVQQDAGIITSRGKPSCGKPVLRQKPALGRALATG